MKILRLRLSNLNSLRGSNAVDFTQPPLTNSGLFAITGPTGAGKTTLLDAITLALYGRVARYGTTPSPDAVMSRHTGECSAEVEFACASGTFRSIWHLQRARKKSDGKLQQAKRRIIALPAETVIAESIKDADAKVLELTGLDYDRFLRSVLLAQGDFAAFLKAGPKERTDLLQEVTGTAIYQDISQAAYRRAGETEQAHANLLRDHQAVPVLGVEQRVQYETTLAGHTQRLTELSAILQTLSKRIADAERWLEIEKAARRLESDQNEYANSRNVAATALAQLESHETAAPFIADLTSLDRFAADHTKDLASLREVESKLPKLARALQEAEIRVQQTQSAFAAEDGRQAQLRVLWTEVSELDNALATAREALRQVTEQHTGFEKSAATITASLANEQKSLQILSKAHSVAVGWIAEHAIDANLAAQLPDIQAAFARWSAGETASTEAQRALTQRQKQVEQLEGIIRALQEKLSPFERDLKAKSDAVEEAIRVSNTTSERLSLPEIEAHRDKTRDQRLALERLAADASRLRTLAADIGLRQKEADHIEFELVRTVDDRKTLHQRHDDVTKLLGAQRIALVFAERVQSLEGHRAVLQESSPCPLCGALDHPYAVDGGLPADDLEAVHQSVATTEADLTSVQRQLTEAEKRHASLLADQKRLATDSRKLNSDHAALKTAWNSAAVLHDLADQFENEAALVTNLSIAQAEESRRSTQFACARAAEDVLQRAKVAQQAAQVELSRIGTEVAKQTALTTQVREQLPALETALAGHRQNAANEKAVFSNVVVNFAPVPTDLVQVPDLVDTLKARTAAFTSRQSIANKVHADLGAQQVKCEALSQQLASATAVLAESLTKLTTAKGDVERREGVRRDKFGNRAVVDAQREAESTLKQARDLAETSRAEAEKLRQAEASATSEMGRLTVALAARTSERQTIADRLHIAATMVGFPNEESIRAALLPPAEATKLIARRQFLDESRVKLATQAAALVEQRASLTPSVIEDAARVATLQTEQTSRESERATSQSSLGEIRAIMKNDDALRARQAAFAIQIDAAHRDYARWDRLRALIGSADGSVFARFAQGLTLERLTILANRHLAQLNPRYSIRRADGEAGDLELEIVDHFQADVARPMRSLSGGESFLASLALALGLSELASGHTSIESLFIDEGFGSLDADTLETAMAALENLQARGKTIGVISHVPAMQERIPAQIKVTKESGGCSTIAILS